MVYFLSSRIVTIFSVVRVVDDDEIYELKERTKMLFLKTSLNTGSGFAYDKTRE
jgi:hypothetical protein